MDYVVTDIPCTWCKESPKRDTKFLVELPIRTKRRSVTVYACPFCDGESLIEKAYEQTNESQGQDLS